MHTYMHTYISNVYPRMLGRKINMNSRKKGTKARRRHPGKVQGKSYPNSARASGSM